MPFSSPQTAFPLGDSITVSCRVRRACANTDNPTYDEGFEMICAMVQPETSSTPTHATNTHTNLHSSSINKHPSADALLSENSDLSSSSSISFNTGNHTTKTLPTQATGPALLFRPVPRPPTRSRASSTPSKVSTNSLISQPTGSHTRARRFHSATTEATYTNSINSSVSSKGKVPRNIKRPSLSAAAVACFATHADLIDDELIDHKRSKENQDVNATTNNAFPMEEKQNEPFSLTLKDIKMVEYVADTNFRPTSPRALKKKGRKRSNNKRGSHVQALPTTSSKYVHPHSFIVTLSTALQHVELSFHNRQSRDLVIAFLRSSIKKSVFRLKTLRTRSNDSSNLNRQASSNSRGMPTTPRHSSRSFGLGLTGTESSSYVDMDNFEGMAVKERFRNESFLEKMQRRCARLAIRTEEACICFDCSGPAFATDDTVKESDRDSTVNTSIMSDREFDFLDEEDTFRGINEEILELEDYSHEEEVLESKLEEMGNPPVARKTLTYDSDDDI